MFLSSRNSDSWKHFFVENILNIFDLKAIQINSLTLQQAYSWYNSLIIINIIVKETMMKLW